MSQVVEAPKPVAAHTEVVARSNRLGAAGIELVPYAPGDESEILALFAKVFGVEKSLAHWRWQFLDNPSGKVYITLVKDVASRRIVGQYAVMPVATNWMGRRIEACQSLDTMIDPGYRLAGMFERSAEDCFARLAADRHGLVYGFPNQSSYPGFVRKLDWQRVTALSGYELRLSVGDRLRRLLGVPVLPRLADAGFRLHRALHAWASAAVLRLQTRHLAFETSWSVPEAYDQLWDAVRSYEVLSIWKDCAYLAWRYDRKPGVRYRYHYLTRGGRIEALCVSTLRNGALRITELIVREHATVVAQRLVAEVVLCALAEKVDRVEFSGVTADLFDEAFRGFRHRRLVNYLFCLRVLGDPRLAKMAENAANWTVTDGDADLA